MKKALLVALTTLLVGGLFAASASAAPRFFEEKGGPLLRSVATLPSKLQPSAIEFNAIEGVTWRFKFLPETTKEELQVHCNEVEVGTTVVTNLIEEKENENKLAMPFGVAEGDECFGGNSGGFVPTFFDTNAAGAVPATITFGGVLPAITAKLHKLKMSFEPLPEEFCTATFENTPGEVVDVGGPFSEESFPNTFIAFRSAHFTGSCVPVGKPLKKFNGELTATLFVETPSTVTDTVWIE
jgi:hypothetical protein